MEDTLLYPRELIAERVRFTPADHAQIALCRGDHHRLGLAYQMAFLRLTGRFPSQQPLERLPAVLAFVAGALTLAPTVMDAYAQRQATVSAHQEQSRLHLGFRAFGPAEREALSQFLREEALHFDHLAALVTQAEAFLRDHQVLLPARSTLRRLAGAQRDWRRQLVATQTMALLPPELPARLDALLHVQAHLGFRSATPLDMYALRMWLVERALEHDKPTLLLQLACDKLRREQIVRPGITRLERFVATARQQAHEETWHRLTPLVTEARCSVLDGLLVPDPQTSRSLLQWFRREATSHAATQLVETLQKITVLREMGVDTWDLTGLNPNRVKWLAQLG